VKIKDLAEIDSKITPFDNEGIKELAKKIIQAYKNDKQIILMMGGHVLKTGMGPYIIDLVKRGVIKHIATNGSVSIHDFELAMIGETSEDVQKNLEDGTFGMSEETGKMMNDALNQSKEGYGKTIAKFINDSDFKYKDYSLFNACYESNVPITVHVAIGTDIIHQHPSCKGESIGRTSYKDFKIFTESVSKLQDGVIINLGSAVLMPEVFLKALTIARNLGYKTDNFTAANLDMVDHYRPRVNVVQRPTSLSGKGYFIEGKHQETIPTLYNLIKGGIEK